LRGRDVEEAEHAVLFDSATCRWTILGEAAEIHRSESRGAILAALESATDPMTPAELVAHTNLTRNNVDQLLARMKHKGEVTNTSRGLYIAAGRTDLVPPRKKDENRKNEAA
jgi:hypothetical protein